MNAFLVVHIRSEMLKIVIPTKTHFSCLDKPAGFYADFDTRCKIYHTCDEYGNKFTYHCPEETAFRQEALICDHAHLVNCQRNISFSSETNFLKLPLQTFSANIQNQQSNTNSNQTAKNRTDFYKVPCINHRNDPYVETLNSIQKSTIIPLTRTSTTVTNVTTELPIYALTLSLKPLIPRELDYDPYYPKFTSTESYYSSSRIPNKLPYVKTILQKSWSNTHIELPSVLPDLRSLEDIVDRRKLFYIPRI
ncbi:PREDICTED: uncharacterized protein LOC107189647 [Dufourea novaeangliae]|uniref:uncharacterized protein LOC107189647 n=1 Tax=Dufourea novaeangliae TaxID=178035 RepID=UPI000767D346|nr:PREDICTED: uncharacterized protein LOC107189647 [Dufourea novaeangliae]